MAAELKHPDGESGNAGAETRSRSSTLFDLRLLIGGLFTLYGVTLIIASFFVSTVKSHNIDINLWLGLGMALLGVLFLVWARWRPLAANLE
jgi:hypothetical protein